MESSANGCVSFKLIHFTKPNTWVGLMWNYDQGILMGTKPMLSYSAAQAALNVLAEDYKVELRWFDGEYTCAGEGEQLLSLNKVKVSRDGHPINPTFEQSLWCK